jgi:DNA end-binding protein Ku
MPARPYWQGHIRLALVSIPVDIYTATKSGASISFRQIHEPTGQPIHYEKVVSGVGPVDTGEILKGYEYQKGKYVLLEDDELEAVKLESKKTPDDIDPIFFDKPYYVVPSNDLAEEAFIVLREAMKSTKKLGIGQLALRGREYIVCLKPCGAGIILETLRYDEELQKAASYFKGISTTKPDADLLNLATNLIENKVGTFDAGAYENRYVEALHALIDRKLKSKGKKIEPEEETAKNSLEGGEDKGSSRPRTEKRPIAKAGAATSKASPAKTGSANPRQSARKKAS